MKFYQEKWAMSTMTNNTWYDEDRRPIYKVNTPFKFSNRTSTIVKFLTDSDETPGPGMNGEGQENPLEDVLAHHSYEQTPPDHTRRNSSGAQSAAGSIDPDKFHDGKLAEDADGVEEPLALSPGSFSRERGSKFIYLAEIDWRRFTSSKFRFGDGLEVMARNFYRKEGWGPYGRHRVFTAKDGKEYKWLQHSFHSEVRPTLALKLNSLLIVLIDKLITNDQNKTTLAKSAQKSFGLIGKAHPGYLEIFPSGEHMVDEIFVTFIYVEKLRKEKEDAAQH
ncbi:hypothetical protein PQX77_007534 [Marasmius sp. AFHP31]|nr:hypothetical protein PQX77_007534 [Marasmius sp. AFHP31]